MTDVAELKKTMDAMGTAFEELKRQNDERHKQYEQKGHADPLLADQVKRIAADVVRLDEFKAQHETKHNRPVFAAPGENGAENKGDPRHAAAFRKYLRTGDVMEAKALSIDIDPQGGYLVEEEMSQQIITRFFETSPLREVAAVETISTDALEIPEDINEAAVGGWTGERAVPTDTATPNIGLRRIPVWELYSNPKATQALLDDARINVESWLAGKIADKLSRIENLAFITGTGAGQPRGLLTYPALGANPQGTPGYVQQQNVAVPGTLDANSLRNIIYSLKAPYINEGTAWLLKRTTLAAITELKDNYGQYLWQPGLQLGAPSTLLGFPYRRMEDMPGIAAGALAVAFGDFKKAYTIVDRMGIRILRDPYSSKPFVSFYTTKRTGGDVTNFEAFALLSC